MRFYQGQKQNFSITNITPKYVTSIMVQEMNFPDARYCQKSWEKIPKRSNMAYSWWVLMNIKIYIPVNLARCDFRLSQPPDKFSNSMYKCLNCRPMSNLRMENENLPGDNPMGLLWTLVHHNYPLISITKLISQELYISSKCRPV